MDSVFREPAIGKRKTGNTIEQKGERNYRLSAVYENDQQEEL
jgi:hypothetical protein